MPEQTALPHREELATQVKYFKALILRSINILITRNGIAVADLPSGPPFPGSRGTPNMAKSAVRGCVNFFKKKKVTFLERFLLMRFIKGTV